MQYIPREEGQGLVEYALILVLVAVVDGEERRGRGRGRPGVRVAVLPEGLGAAPLGSRLRGRGSA